jgi:Ser/Thr protein kinase RdoA (MazF antagonist)
VNDERSDYFYALTPEKILEAIESTGLRCSGRCLPLNSMENRVFEVELELSDEERESLTSRSQAFRVAKFYRPGRWSKEQVQEEHQFLYDLVASDIPVITPIAQSADSSVYVLPGLDIYFTIFPKCGGRCPDELSDEQLLWLGRLLARMHIVGAERPALHRLTISPASYGWASLETLKALKPIPQECETMYYAAVERGLSMIEPLFEGISNQRIHGDCHFGNIIWGDEGPFFVDFDDMLNGPPVQDMWLVTPGRDAETDRQRLLLVEGYEQIRHFDRASLRLIEPLRFLRMVHFNGWIAKRWHDPAFQRAFPFFTSIGHWRSEIAAAEDLVRIMEERASSLF